jgi:hypothetical protein
MIITVRADALHYCRRGQARLLDEDIEGAVNDFTQGKRFNLPSKRLNDVVIAAYQKAGRF